jgi:hypothetical protein
MNRSSGEPARFASVALASSIAALAIIGCGSSTHALSGDLEIALGGTESDGSGFAALEGDVSLIPGAQGGFHVWMKYRVTGEYVGMVRIAYTARRISDGRLVLSGGRVQEIGPAGDAGYWESPSAIPAFMCPSPLGVQVRDEPIRFGLEIFTPDTPGTSLASATAEVTPHCPDGDQAVFCVRICSG